MHENRHFLSYRKRRHDAENHVYICAPRHLGVAAKWLQQPQGYRLGKNSVRISKDEAPTLLSVAGPLFISSLLFPLSRALLGAWRFSLFRSVQLSQQAGPHQGACLLLGVLFYFPNLSLFVSSYVKMKKFCLFQFSRLAISWPPWVRVWGWASYRFLPFTVFSLGFPFCFLSYIVHLRCMSDGGSLNV